MDKFFMRFTMDDVIGALYIIVIFAIAFFLLRLVYLRIKEPCVLFKKGEKREAWGAILRSARQLAVIAAGIALIKYIMILGIIIVMWAIIAEMPGDNNNGIPPHYYDN